MKLERFREIVSIDIFRGELFAGTLERTDQGSVFKYSEDYLAFKELSPSGIAFRMPISKKVYSRTGDNLLPFFAGLLPEGLRLTALVSSLKTSADDMFSLLAASGTESVGDVYAVPEVEGVNSTGLAQEEFDKVSFIELFEKSIGAPDYSARLKDPSISGVHPKISSSMLSFPVGVTNRNRRYILKLGPKKYPRLVENELFFMRMAKACGLEAAEVQIVKDKNQESALLVERFDRKYNKEKKRIERLHVEDACQFLDRYPQDKYRISISEITEGIQSFCTSPIIELAKFVRLISFSYLIGNGDMHAKNISLLSSSKPNSRVGLSPAYDLLSTLPYGDQKMALKIDGRDDKIAGRVLAAFAKRFDLPEKALKGILSDLCEAAEPWIERVPEIELQEKKAEFLQSKMKERMGDLLSF